MVQVLDIETTILGGATIYGAGNYGAGIYSGGASNYVVFEPKAFEEVWEPNSIVCNTDSTSLTIFAVYLDTATPDKCLGSTDNGNQGTVYLPAVEITQNNLLIGVWFGGDVGAHASAMMIGDCGALTP